MSRNKSRTGTSTPTWRSISQNGRLRSSSRAARQRRMSRLLRGAALALAVLTAGAALGYGVYFSGQKMEVFNPAPDPTPITRITFQSDGVLDTSWLQRHFPVPQGTPALNFDVHAMKERIESYAQVKRATVSISLPNKLVVRVEEHVPLLRARVQTPHGVVKTVLIAEDGTVFEAHNHSARELRQLPGLVGARFRQSGERYLPIKAMKTLAPLIHEAKNAFPEIYRDWEWISLQHMTDDPAAPNALISVRSRNADTIVFAPRVYHRQLRKLSEVVAMAREQEVNAFRKIDLSFTDQAIVQMRES